MTGFARVPRPAIAALAAIVVLVMLRPWTIRPIESSRPEVFDAGSYVDDLWPRVLDAARTGAVSVTEAAGANEGAASARRATFVRGSGVVTAVDRSSRVGLAAVRLDGTADAVVRLQIGPVLRGTAIRDAADFVAFSDFANQTDFAAVANGLNERALTTVIEPADPDALAGRHVTFVGAAVVDPNRPDAALDVLPVGLEVSEVDP